MTDTFDKNKKVTDIKKEINKLEKEYNKICEKLEFLNEDAFNMEQQLIFLKDKLQRVINE